VTEELGKTGLAHVFPLNINGNGSKSPFKRKEKTEPQIAESS
jgi:hypothetical protein